jgi:hypothetical protein
VNVLTESQQATAYYANPARTQKPRKGRARWTALRMELGGLRDALVYLHQ